MSATNNTPTVHPLNEMDVLEKLEMELEWDDVVDVMKLQEILAPRGFDFARKMFIEAYSRGYMKRYNITKK